jgi:hypothetical protein
MDPERVIGLRANIRTMHAQHRILNGLIDPTNIEDQQRTWLEAYGNPRLARQAARQALAAHEARTNATKSTGQRRR